MPFFRSRNNLNKSNSTIRLEANKNIGFANIPTKYSDNGTRFTVKSPSAELSAEVCSFPWFAAERIKR